MFGLYGSKEHRLKANKWSRITITMQCGVEDGLKTYVNGKLCATVRRGVFVTTNSRFSLAMEEIMLFGVSERECYARD